MSDSTESQSSDIESILDKIRRNSIQMGYTHKKEYENFKSKLVYYKIPTIILSSINSVFSVGLAVYMPQHQVSVLNCLISLICGIIVSVELYLQLEKSMANELEVSKSYHLLAIEIQKFLLTDRANRSIDCAPFLDKSYNQYTKLFENSRLLEKSINDNLCDLNDADKISGVTITPNHSQAIVASNSAFLP